MTGICSKEIPEPNSPLNVNSAPGGAVGEGIPGADGQVDVVAVAGAARVGDGDFDGVALAADAVVAARITDAQATAAVGRLVLVLHPVHAQRRDHVAVAVLVATRAVGTQLLVDGALTVAIAPVVSVGYQAWDWGLEGCCVEEVDVRKGEQEG